jgi:hypothetical protein
MFGKNSNIFFCGALLVLFLAACSQPKNKPNIEALDKIHFDLNILNEQGLYGASDGLQALSYEFCIPAEEKYAAEVQSIDSTVKISFDSPGRIGCSEKEYLCIGNTYQKNCREILIKLAGLEYIEKIDQGFFEH